MQLSPLNHNVTSVSPPSHMQVVAKLSYFVTERSQIRCRYTALKFALLAVDANRGSTTLQVQHHKSHAAATAKIGLACPVLSHVL